MKLHKVSALAAISVLAFAACSSGGGASTAPSAAGGSPASAARAARPRPAPTRSASSSTEIHVYSSLPLEGTSLPQSTAIQDEIKATLDGQKIGNFTIKYTSLDDASAAKDGDWDPTVEQANANKAVNDPDAMVYIGTYNSGAAKLSIPILNAACLVMFSPANSYPGLTKAVAGVTEPGEPDSYYPAGYRNYARDINTDDVQGAASSEWAFSLGKKTAYVLDDGQTYGQGIGRCMGPAFRQDRRQGRQRQRQRPRAMTPRRPTTARSRRRSSRRAPTSCSSAPSPARARRSSGRTSAPPTRTSRCSARTASTRSRGPMAPVRPPTAPT